MKNSNSPYALFIKYPQGTGQYNGVYPNLEITFDVIHEMMEDMKLSMSESPDILKAANTIKTEDDFEYTFSDGTWIVITVIPERQIDDIITYRG